MVLSVNVHSRENLLILLIANDFKAIRTSMSRDKLIFFSIIIFEKEKMHDIYVIRVHELNKNEKTSVPFLLSGFIRSLFCRPSIRLRSRSYHCLQHRQPLSSFRFFSSLNRFDEAARHDRRDRVREL